jgi:Alpha-L-arabinofuranosidase B, catalytic
MPCPPKILIPNTTNLSSSALTSRTLTRATGRSLQLYSPGVKGERGEKGDAGLDANVTSAENTFVQYGSVDVSGSLISMATTMFTARFATPFTSDPVVILTVKEGGLCASLNTTSKTGFTAFVTNTTGVSLTYNASVQYMAMCGSATPIPVTTPGLLSFLSTPLTFWNGIFSLKLLNDEYAGAVIGLRRSSDNATMDFYSTTTGVLTSKTGIPVASFLENAVGFVHTWYDQSGKGNNATQSTTSFQPFLDLTNNCIDFGFRVTSQTMYHLNMPTGTIPVNRVNAEYSFVVKHGNAQNLFGGFLAAGTLEPNKFNAFTLYGSLGDYINYQDFFYRNSQSQNYDPLNPIPAVAAVTFNGLTRTGYRDGVFKQSTSRNGMNTQASNQIIGRGMFTTSYLQGQLYSLLICSTALPQADITILNAL